MSSLYDNFNSFQETRSLKTIIIFFIQYSNINHYNNKFKIHFLLINQNHRQNYYTQICLFHNIFLILVLSFL
jgi:hypothetical protein